MNWFVDREIYRAEEKKRKEKIRSRMVDDLWDGSSISPAHGDADNESAQLERYDIDTHFHDDSMERTLLERISPFLFSYPYRAVLRLVIDEGEIHKLTPKQIHDRYLRSVQFLKKYRSSVDRVLSGDYSIAELAEEIASEDESGILFPLFFLFLLCPIFLLSSLLFFSGKNLISSNLLEFARISLLNLHLSSWLTVIVLF